MSLEFNQTYKFSYTGNIQSITLPNGMYKFQLWGAQGSVNGAGNYNGIGYGGYSEGTIILSKSTVMYIVVGGYSGSQNGGYNGGGTGGTDTSSASRYGGGGGGATHISFKTGLLKDLSSHMNDVLLVAGGGGGAGEYGGPHRGHGGGLQALNGWEQASINYVNTGQGGASAGGGGSVTGPGRSPYSSSSGKFGLGGTAYSHYCSGSGGGGGGFYGGAAGYCSTDHGSGYSGNGGGGSGYINNIIENGITKTGNSSFPSISNGTEVGHLGNGYVIITCESLPVHITYKNCSGDILYLNKKDILVNVEASFTKVEDGTLKVFCGYHISGTKLNLIYTSSTNIQFYSPDIDYSQDLEITIEALYEFKQRINSNYYRNVKQENIFDYKSLYG